MNSPQTEVSKEIKTLLCKYSPQLRRDFLAILVKMAAKEFSLVTVREDWRTKEGMLKFLEKVWDMLQPLLFQNNAISWFCGVYSTIEQVFSDRKFALYLQAYWSKYARIVLRQDILIFMKYYQKQLKSILKGETKIPEEWLQLNFAKDFFEMVNEYLSKRKEGNPLPDVIKTMEQPHLSTSEEDQPHQDVPLEFEEPIDLEMNYQLFEDDSLFSFAKNEECIL